MKRFFFWFVAGIAAIAVFQSHRDRRERDGSHVVIVRHVPTDGGRRDALLDRATGGQVVIIERDGRQTIAVDEQGVVITENSAHAGRDARVEVEDNVVYRSSSPEPAGERRVDVEGLPVPVVAGTRTTEARIEPPTPPEPPKPRGRVSRAKASRTRNVATKPAPKIEPTTITGRLSATEQRARDDARALLVKSLHEKLAPKVPADWTIPAKYIDGMIKEVRITPHERDYGTVYDAQMTVEYTPQRRDQIVRAFQRERSLTKLTVLGGGLTFLLVCLASLSGYIRADEATKGYYTNRLRVLSTIGVGAAGVVLYKWLA